MSGALYLGEEQREDVRLAKTSLDASSADRPIRASVGLAIPTRATAADGPSARAGRFA